MVLAMYDGRHEEHGRREELRISPLAGLCATSGNNPGGRGFQIQLHRARGSKFNQRSRRKVWSALVCNQNGRCQDHPCTMLLAAA